MTMHETIARMYDAFNRRDVDATLAQVSDDVSWPKASEGGRVVGKSEIRAYWERQWAEFDPHVEILAIAAGEGNVVEVEVHQLVKDLHGDVLSDSAVTHVYRVANGLIERMDVVEPGGSTDGPSAAFSKEKT